MHDLVVASYVLTEMQSDDERQQAVDMLWRQTKDVLVLVEPGTPSGSAFVRQARSQVSANSVHIGREEPKEPSQFCEYQKHIFVANCIHTWLCYGVITLSPQVAVTFFAALITVAAPKHRCPTESIKVCCSGTCAGAAGGQHPICQ